MYPTNTPHNCTIMRALLGGNARPITQMGKETLLFGKETLLFPKKMGIIPMAGGHGSGRKPGSKGETTSMTQLRKSKLKSSTALNAAGEKDAKQL